MKIINIIKHIRQPLVKGLKQHGHNILTDGKFYMLYIIDRDR